MPPLHVSPPRLGRARDRGGVPRWRASPSSTCSARRRGGHRGHAAGRRDARAGSPGGTGPEDVLALAVMAAKPRGRPGRPARLARGPAPRPRLTLASSALLAVAASAHRRQDFLRPDPSAQGHSRRFVLRRDPPDPRPKGVTDEQRSTFALVAAAHSGRPEAAPQGGSQVDHVAAVSPPRLAADGRAAEVDVALNIQATSTYPLRLAGSDGLLRAFPHAGAPDGAQVLVGGTASIFADVSSSIKDDLLADLPGRGAPDPADLVLMLRSVVAPLYLLPAVGLEFAATFGAAVLVFQDGPTPPLRSPCRSSCSCSWWGSAPTTTS